MIQARHYVKVTASVEGEEEEEEEEEEEKEGKRSTQRTNVGWAAAHQSSFCCCFSSLVLGLAAADAPRRLIIKRSPALAAFEREGRDRRVAVCMLLTFNVIFGHHHKGCKTPKDGRSARGSATRTHSSL